MNKNEQSEILLVKLRKILNRYYAAAGISGLLVLISGISDLLIYPYDKVVHDLLTSLSFGFWFVCWQVYASLEKAVEQAPKWLVRQGRAYKPKALRRRNIAAFWIILLMLGLGFGTYQCWPYSVRSVFLAVLTVIALCRVLWDGDDYRTVYYYLTKEEE